MKRNTPPQKKYQLPLPVFGKEKIEMSNPPIAQTDPETGFPSLTCEKDGKPLVFLAAVLDLDGLPGQEGFFCYYSCPECDHEYQFYVTKELKAGEA